MDNFLNNVPEFPYRCIEMCNINFKYIHYLESGRELKLYKSFIKGTYSMTNAGIYVPNKYVPILKSYENLCIFGCEVINLSSFLYDYNNIIDYQKLIGLDSDKFIDYVFEILKEVKISPNRIFKDIIILIGSIIDDYLFYINNLQFNMPKFATEKIKFTIIICEFANNRLDKIYEIEPDSLYPSQIANYVIDNCSSVYYMPANHIKSDIFVFDYFYDPKEAKDCISFILDHFYIVARISWLNFIQ